MTLLRTHSLCSSRRLLLDKRLWSTVSDKEFPRRTGCKVTQLRDQGHPEAVAQAENHQPDHPLCRWLSGRYPPRFPLLLQHMGSGPKVLAQMNHLVEKEQWSHPLTLLFHFCFFKPVKRRASAVDGPCPHWLHWNTRNALSVSNPSHALTLKTSEWWWGGFLVPHCELVPHWQC